MVSPVPSASSDKRPSHLLPLLVIGIGQATNVHFGYAILVAGKATLYTGVKETRAPPLLVLRHLTPILA